MSVKLQSLHNKDKVIDQYLREYYDIIKLGIYVFRSFSPIPTIFINQPLPLIKKNNIPILASLYTIAIHRNDFMYLQRDRMSEVQYFLSVRDEDLITTSRKIKWTASSLMLYARTLQFSSIKNWTTSIRCITEFLNQTKLSCPVEKISRYYSSKELQSPYLLHRKAFHQSHKNH